MWSVAVDWDKDGDFSGAYDGIWDDVVSVKWRLGMGKPYQSAADESTCEIVVRNVEGKYNPDNAASPLYGKLLPQRPIQISATVGMTVVPLWRGWLDTVTPEWSPAGAATGRTTATITGIGAKALLQDSELALPLMTDKRGDEIIMAALAGVSLPGLDLETGQTDFAIYGDQDKATSAYKVIQDITEAERGRFFFDREGKAVWWNRHHLLLHTGVDGVVDSTGASGRRPTDITYEFGKSLANRVAVTVYPRKVGTPMTLWELDSAVRIRAGDKVSFETPFLNAEGERTGADDVSLTGAIFSDGAATLTLDDRADLGIVTAENVGSVEAVLTALSVVGTPIRASNTLVVRVEDAASIATHGRRGEVKLNLRALDTAYQAQQIARFELTRRSTPRGEVSKVRFLGEADGVANAEQLDWTIGARLRLKHPELGHDSQAFVIGEQHTVHSGGRVHETTYTLEPASANAFWILGVSRLGVDTILGY